MQPSLLNPNKNAKPGFLRLLALTALTGFALFGIFGIVHWFGTAWHPTAEIICFFIPGLILAAPSSKSFKTIKVELALAAILGLGAGVLSHLVLPYWQQLFPVPHDYEEVLQTYLHLGWWPGFGFDLLSIALIPAVCEEVFFRSLIFSELKNTYSLWLAFFISALFFSLAHFVPAYWPLYFLLGLGAAWIYETSGLFAAIMAHFIFNATGLIFWQWR